MAALGCHLRLSTAARFGHVTRPLASISKVCIRSRTSIPQRQSRWAQYSSEASPAQNSRQVPPAVEINGKTYKTDEWYNAPSNVLSATSRRLHLQKDHPVAITRQIIESIFPRPTYKYYNTFDPVVSTFDNFDSLGFPHDHPGRNRSDTYYINKDTLLRTHTSAHQLQIFRRGETDGYLVSADVYRRDEVDRTHYPVFHQMEGARIWDRETVPGGDLAAAVWADLETLPKPSVVVEDPNPPFHAERNPLQPEHSPAEAEAIAAHLKRSLELMVAEIFSRVRTAAAKAKDQEPASEEPLRVRWVEAYFPFTSPSWELEVFYNDQWLEVLGSGVVQQALFKGAGRPSQAGWAFGIGLERIAMLLFQIPDIRLFWSTDPRFLDQFTGVEKDLSLLRRFVPFSKYPPCFKDVSFWVDGGTSTSSPSAAAAGGDSLKHDPTAPQATSFHANDAMEVIRSVAGDIVEDVSLVDEFTHPKTGRRSLCYRINYRSLERTLTNEETNRLHQDVTKELVARLGVEIRA